MNIDLRPTNLGSLTGEFHDDSENGAYVDMPGGRLWLRPPYQREFVYKPSQMVAVIMTALKGYPLGDIYFAVNADGTFEVIDGQQRLLSLLHFINGDFSVVWDGDTRYFHNLPDELKAIFLEYCLHTYYCDGNEHDKLEWFKTINIAGEELNDQELLNATYHGEFVSSAREMFSKTGCRAVRVSQLDGKPLVKGVPIRQDILETVLEWVVDAENLSNSGSADVEDFMARHQHDRGADQLWDYFDRVMGWVKRKFTAYRKEMAGVQWGLLFNRYEHTEKCAPELEDEIARLMADDDVTSKTGVYEYVLSGDERALSLRKFTDTQKRTAYEKQGHKCAHCGREFAYEDMQGDHIVPWSRGGKTVPENCQMLCAECNNRKSARA